MPPAEPPSAQPAAVQHLSPEEFDRWYGGWDARLDPGHTWAREL